MADQVIITKDQLLAVGAGPVYLNSPDEEEKTPPLPPFMHEDWNEEQEALVYEDWGAAVERFASDEEGLALLRWLVSRALVPMSHMQFRKVRKDARSANRPGKE